MTLKYAESSSSNSAGRHWSVARWPADSPQSTNKEPSTTTTTTSPRMSTDDEVALSFENDGFVVLPQGIPLYLLQEWRDFGDDYFRRCFEVLHQMGHTSAPFHQVTKNNQEGGRQNYEYVLGLGAKNGYREVVMRSPGRYELSLLNLHPQEFEKVSNSSINMPDTTCILKILEPLLPRLLGKQGDTRTDTSSTNIKLCHLSLLVATPGSADQGWHADGGHLSVLKHFPCHCFNIFIPLQDVPAEMGPTEFRPGGHYLTRNLAPMMLAAKCRKTLRSPVCPSLKLGDVLLFDYRVLHRGRANNTLQNRNVLVMTFCEPWFEDVLNFPKRSMLEPSNDDFSGDEEDTASLQ